MLADGLARSFPDVRRQVDPALRVHGLSGLRVVDCSIMPTLVSGNTSAPVVMIAEKASDLILAEAREAAQARTTTPRGVPLAEPAHS